MIFVLAEAVPFDQSSFMSEADEEDESLCPAWNFRCLCKAIWEGWDERVDESILQPWLAENGARCAVWLQRFTDASKGVPVVPQEDSNGLYAASRVSQLLLRRFQPFLNTELKHHGPALESIAAYQRFFIALGMYVESPVEFSPFYHEIVQVEEASDPQQPPVLLARFWPCLMLGDLMFSRAGVRISVGRDIMDKSVAESSMLFWGYTRSNRPYQDLSHGFGSNSQWRTGFRRDYRMGGDFYLNVDGRCYVTEEPFPEAPDPLPAKVRAELVKFHHYVRADSTALEKEPFPYEYYLKMPANDYTQTMEPGWKRSTRGFCT